MKPESESQTFLTPEELRSVRDALIDLCKVRSVTLTEVMDEAAAKVRGIDLEFEQRLLLVLSVIDRHLVLAGSQVWRVLKLAESICPAQGLLGGSYPDNLDHATQERLASLCVRADLEAGAFIFKTWQSQGHERAVSLGHLWGLTPVDSMYLAQFYRAACLGPASVEHAPDPSFVGSATEPPAQGGC